MKFAKQQAENEDQSQEKEIQFFIFFHVLFLYHIKMFLSGKFHKTKPLKQLTLHFLPMLTWIGRREKRSPVNNYLLSFVSKYHMWNWDMIQKHTRLDQHDNSDCPQHSLIDRTKTIACIDWSYYKNEEFLYVLVRYNLILTTCTWVPRHKSGSHMHVWEEGYIWLVHTIIFLQILFVLSIYPMPNK